MIIYFEFKLIKYIIYHEATLKNLIYPMVIEYFNKWKNSTCTKRWVKICKKLLNHLDLV